MAYCLLNDCRMVVIYEPMAIRKTRRPDFAVTYRADLVFYIEAARIRMDESIVSGNEDRAKQLDQADRCRQSGSGSRTGGSLEEHFVG